MIHWTWCVLPFSFLLFDRKDRAQTAPSTPSTFNNMRKQGANRMDSSCCSPFPYAETTKRNFSIILPPFTYENVAQERGKKEKKKRPIWKCPRIDVFKLNPPQHQDLFLLCLSCG
uniref:Secreted protein n=1 Tax=Daphnia galeata TaxID=27404 RepID=A0A8J2WGE2_9CRUS|nr:unnamed protein product [Daphnia galeata]